MLILWEGEEDQIATPRGTGPGVYKHFWDQISYQGYSLGPQVLINLQQNMIPIETSSLIIWAYFRVPVRKRGSNWQPSPYPILIQF